MIDVISVNIDSNGKVKTSSKTLCNQYENGVAQFKLNVPPDWQDDSYYYYLCVVPPESAGLKQYAVPLTEEFIFLISSGITWHLGTWKFVFMVLNSELPDTGVVPTEGIVSISDSWEGSVNKSILNLDDLAEQPVDPNFTLLYTDLMALRNSVENTGEYAQAQGDYAKDEGDYAKDEGDYAKNQGDYAKGVGEQLEADKANGVFDGEDGEDGVSPTVSVATSTSTEYTLSITDANGTITTPNLKGSDGTDGDDGVSPVVEVNTSTSTTYTLDITDANGTITTPNLIGPKGSPGSDGDDGVSPTVAVHSNTSSEYTLDITDANGTITTPNLKGPQGDAGTTDYNDLTNKPDLTVYASKALYGDTTINVGRKANSTVGTRSVAEGYNAIASGTSSHAEGYVNVASGNYSHAEGNRVLAMGASSHAEGSETAAIGPSSHTEGGVSTNVRMLITGDANATTYTTSDTSNIVVGSYVQYKDVIQQVASFVTNTSVTLYGTLSSSAIDSDWLYILNVVAEGQSSHAEGTGTKAKSKSQHVQGEYNVSDTTGTSSTRGTYAEIVGNGASVKNPSNAYTLDWSGNGWFAGDVYVGSTSGTNKDSGSKKLATENYVAMNSSKKISSIQSFYGVSSSTSTQPDRWTLPGDYQEIEYLQSTATELIDTGVDAIDVRKIECKFATMNYTGSQYITGARASNPNRILFAIDGSGSNTKFSALYNATSVMTTNIDRANGVVVNASLAISEAVEGKRTMTFKCNDGTYDETITQADVNDLAVSGYTVGIFGWNTSNKTSSRIYREKIYTDSGLVRDYVPCLQKSTGKYGLYDMVEGKFYTATVDFTYYGSNTTYVPQMTSDAQYMWKKDIITYSEGTTQINTPYVIENKCEGGSSGGGTSDAYIDLSLEAGLPTISNTANVEALETIITNYTTSNSLAPHIIVDQSGEKTSCIILSVQSANGSKEIQFALVGNTTSQNITSLNVVSYAFTYSNNTWQFQALTSYDFNNFLTSTTAGSLYASKTLYTDTTINTGRSANTTVGTASAALGRYNTASATGAFAIGAVNVASGADSVATGEECTASGETSIAGGMASEASGDESFAYGDSVIVSGDVSTGFGEGTLAQSNNQFVLGKYNVGESNDTYAEILGNGRWVVGTGAVRSNARTTDWSGNGWYAGNIKVGGTSYSDSNAKELATKDYVDSLVSSGATKTILYNGKANNTAVLSGNIQQLSDSIFNYDAIVVGFNCSIGSMRSMEICDIIYPNANLIEWCDGTGAGATGAHHIFNSNQAFNNCYRIMWGFTDATHIRNIVSAHVNTGTYGWIDEGICYVIGYKFNSIVTPSNNIVTLTSIPEDFLYARGDYEATNTFTITNTDDLDAISNSAQLSINGPKITTVSLTATITQQTMTGLVAYTFPVNSSMVMLNNNVFMGCNISFFKEAFDLNNNTWRLGYDFAIVYQSGSATITRTRRGS